MISAYNGHKDIVRLLLEKNADATIKDCFDKTALDRAKDQKIIKMLQEGSKIAQRSSTLVEQEKAVQMILNPSPKGKENPNSILKKSTPGKKGSISRSQDLDNIKVHNFSGQNYTPASSGYPSARPHGFLSPQNQPLSERLATSPLKNDFLSPQSHRKNSSRDNNYSYLVRYINC